MHFWVAHASASTVKPLRRMSKKRGRCLRAVPVMLGKVLIELVFPVLVKKRISSQGPWAGIRLIGADTCAKKTKIRVFSFH